MALGLNPEIETQRKAILSRLGYSFERPKQLADAVLKLSDFYIAQPMASTPWHESWAQAAYLAYYLPLNHARVSEAALKAAEFGFYRGLKSAIDFGSGLGSGQIAVQSAAPEIAQMICHDLSPKAMELHRALLGANKTSVEWNLNFDSAKLPNAASRLAVLSYVYTELKELPKWVRDSEAILLIEPSTREDGRRIQTLRAELIQEGFQVFAPCTHQNACPLLEESERDWCHHRINWKADEDWLKLEQQLPMKNRTLTFSYLAARKSEAPQKPNGELARIVGDVLPEKGKTRQMVCRGPHREFLSWFPGRMKSEPDLKRGDLLRFSEDPKSRGIEMKANEIRIKDDLAIEKL